MLKTEGAPADMEGRAPEMNLYPLTGPFSTSWPFSAVQEAK